MLETHDQNSPTASQRAAGWAAVVATAIFFHIVTFLHLDSYYATHLPHYDAIGSYTRMFEIINAYHAEGWNAAFFNASHYDLSWLQGFFAVVGAPFLEKTPASVQLYNTLCVFGAMSSIFLAATTLGLSAVRSYVASICVFVPDVFYEVQGGLADLSRDPSYVLLLAASLFAWLAFAWRPTYGRSVFFGLLCGLTTLSRSSAFPFQILMFGPLVAWGVFASWRRSALRTFCWRLLPAVAVFSAVAGAFLVLRFGPQMERYRNPYIAYAIGDSVVESVKSHWTKPAELIVGQLRDANSLQTGGSTVSAWAAGSIAVISALLLLTGVVRFSFRDAWAKTHNRILLAAGAWGFSATLLLLFLVAKPKPLAFVESKFPFYPTLLGFFAVSLFLVQTVQPGLRIKNATTAAGLALALLAASAISLTGFVRSRAKTPPGDAFEIATVLNLAEHIRKDDGRPPMVAFFWHEGFSIDSMKFYAARNGYRAPVKLLYQYGGEWQDFAVTAPAGVDPAEMMRAAEAEVYKNADIIVLNENLAHYHNPASGNPLFRAGAEMIGNLMSNDRYLHELTFSFRGEHFALLRRK